MKTYSEMKLFLQIHSYFADEIFTRGWQKLWVIVTTPHTNWGNDALSDNLEETARVGGGSAAGKGDQKVEDPVPSKHMEEVVEGWAVNHEQTLVVLVGCLASEDIHKLLYHTEPGEDSCGWGHVEQCHPPNLRQLGLAQHPHDEGDGVEVVQELGGPECPQVGAGVVAVK